jgi:hypothetical protein
MVRSIPRGLAAGVALLALAYGPAGAQQQTAYKCVNRSGVTYTQMPCAGGHEVGAGSRRVTDKSVAPPQDRATLARRSTLSAGEKQECRTLDVLMRGQQAHLKELGSGAALQDEMPLVHNKRRYREIGC